ncbi:hypothetical protein VTJ04DRAFT_10242 [Mycothermus thermophilus]|uniref:uncharacterized protein n=1 Tax=Humicola insolens TaxID=85995 RepID=UPI003741E94F
MPNDDASKKLYALINNPALFKEHVNKEVAHIFQLQERIKNIIASNDPMEMASLATWRTALTMKQRALLNLCLMLVASPCPKKLKAKL